MKPSRPYLVRALYDWINDSECTPHLLVNTEISGVSVPEAYIEDGRIILNIKPSAVANFTIDDQAVYFDARFGGVGYTLYIPMAAIMAIYAKENADGMGFGSEPGAAFYTEEANDTPSTVDSPADTAKEKEKRPNLKVIK